MQFTGFWSWNSWLGGWLLRIVAQAAFFAMLGELLESPERLRYLVIGNGVVVGALAVNWTIPASTWDRGDGTYPLLVIAPSSLLPAIIGRTSIWLANGVATSVMSLVVLAVVFRIELAWPGVLAVVPLVALTCGSVFCFALFLGSLITRAPQARNVVHNSALTALMAFCGVSVPVAFWPAWVEMIANVLPLTHGLAAIRIALDGGAALTALAEAGKEIAVAAGWLAVSLLTTDRMADGGRADGSIEFTA
jgi:ABC-2 type transport system permease protein